MVIGNIYIMVSAILGGAWMDLSILGKPINTIANILPFSHAIEASRSALAGKIQNIWFHLAIVCIYAIVFIIIAVISFNRMMKSDIK